MRREFVESSSTTFRVPNGGREFRVPTGRAGGDDESLATYLNSMGECQTFSAEAEFEAAKELWTARTARWAALLSYPPLVASVVEAVGGAQAQTAVIEAAEAFRTRRSSANEEAFAAAARSAAEALVELDRDGEIAEKLIRDIERMVRNEREGLLLDVARLPGDSRPFRAYVERCRASQVRVRRLIHEFARANLRLVVALARRLGRGRMPIVDLVQEGNLGLLKAIDRFDHRRGFRFSTYAAWWIRHAISRAIHDKGREVRLPVHVHDVQQKILRTRREFAVSHGREPSLDELAATTGVPLAKLTKIAGLETGPILSLDAPSSRGDERNGVELLEDEDSPDLGFALEAEELAEGLEAALGTLEPMEADILRRRYGLAGAAPETLREIGELYALSRERIRQLQERAVGRMREEFGRRQLL